MSDKKISKNKKIIIVLMILGLLGSGIYFFKAKQKSKYVSDQATAIIDYN